MVHHSDAPSPSDRDLSGGTVALAEPGSRRIWPSPIPAHAIFTPAPPTEKGTWQNDLHLAKRPQLTP